MSIESTIARNGKTVRWRKMAGTGGTYNTATSKVDPPYIPFKDIKALIDGFGSVESQLRGADFGNKTLIQEGQLRLYTVTNVRPGDIVSVDEEVYTAFYNKSIWKKSKAVCYEVLVQL